MAPRVAVAPAHQPGLRGSFVTLHLIALLTVLVHLAFAGARITLSLFALALGATPFTVGLIMSLLAIVPMLFAVGWGRYVDRVGVRGPMFAGSAAVLAAMLLAFLVPRLETLFAVSVIAGSGFILFHICVNQAVGLIGRAENRAKNFSLLALAFSTANVIGPTVAGFAIDWVGHRYTFLLLGGAALAALVVLASVKGGMLRHGSAHKTGEKRRLADLLRIPALRRVFVASGVLSMSWDLFTFVMPIHCSRLGLSASTIGLILGCFGGAVFIVRLILPLLIHRVSEWKMLIGAMFVTGFAIAAIPVIEGVPLLMGLAFILGMGLGGAQPMIMALLYNQAPSGRGAEAIGVRTLLLNTSQAGIPLLFGALGAALGMAPVFWTMALTLLAGGYYARKG